MSSSLTYNLPTLEIKYIGPVWINNQNIIIYKNYIYINQTYVKV